MTFLEQSKISGLKPERLKAIEILEFIAEEKKNDKMFDGEQWYKFEDYITKLIKSK